MAETKRAITWVAVLLIICGLLIWHVVQWHFTGMYLNMLSWTGTNKAYITVLYNLGLMVLIGAVLGLLMEKITEVMGYRIDKIELSGGKTKDSRRR